MSPGPGRTWALPREMRNRWRMLSREVRKVILVFKDSSSFFLRIYCFGPNRKQGAPSGDQKMTETHDQTCFSPTSLAPAHLPKHKLDQILSTELSRAPHNLHNYQVPLLCMVIEGAVSYYPFLKTIPSKPTDDLLFPHTHCLPQVCP